MKFSFPPESKPLEGYTIKRAIHRGGFGEVYYALSDAGKEVALKLLHTNLDVELRGVAQCLNLNHPNLVSIFDVREDREGDSWVIMEYVPGPSLDRMIEMNPGGMQLDDIEHWLSGIAAGLSFLHDRGIVHRDLKPANVYSDGKQIKLGDVGLSKFISESRRSAQTQSVGTVYYMAPEVAKGRYGREVDIYGLGIVLYEMLTGRVPFEGETTAEILMKHLSERPNLQAVPAPLRPLLARTLDKDPRNRPADANELAQGFAQVRLAVGDARLRSPDPVAEQKYARAFVQPTQRSNPAMEKTVLSDPNAEQIAVPQPNSLATEFQKMPAAVRWTMGGLLFLILMRSGMLSPALFQIVIQGAVLGGIAYGIYSVFSRATGRGKAVQPTQNAAAQLAAATPVRPGRPVADKSDPAVNQWIHREPAVPTPPTLKQQRAAKKRLVKTYSPETNRQAGFRQRMTELTGSMTIAILSTALLTGGLYLLTDFLKDPGAIALFGVTTLVASWAVLIPSKMVEGNLQTDTCVDSVFWELVASLVRPPLDLINCCL